MPIVILFCAILWMWVHWLFDDKFAQSRNVTLVIICFPVLCKNLRNMRNINNVSLPEYKIKLVRIWTKIAFQWHILPACRMVLATCNKSVANSTWVMCRIPALQQKGNAPPGNLQPPMKNSFHRPCLFNEIKLTKEFNENWYNGN